MSSGSFKNVIDNIRLQIIYSTYVYIEDLALNNPQELICHKTLLTIYIYVCVCVCVCVMINTVELVIRRVNEISFEEVGKHKNIFDSF